MNWSPRAHGIVLTALLIPIILWVASSNALSEGIITYKHSGEARRIYAFFIKQEDQLPYVRYRGASTEWRWARLSPPGLPVSALNAITYVDDSGARRIYVFATSLDGRLYMTWCRGAPCDTPEVQTAPRWSTWFDLCQPPQGVTMSSPRAITYLDDLGVRRIRVFLTAADGKLWMWDCGGPGCDMIPLFTTPTCNWTNLGPPSNNLALGGPNTAIGVAVVTYRDDQNRQRIYVFAQSEDRRLYKTRCIVGSDCTWNWADLGSPTNAAGRPLSLFRAPGATAYRDGNTDLIYVFSLADDHQLHMIRCIGDLLCMPWEQRGTFQGGQGQLERPPTVVTWLSSTDHNRRIYVFALDSTNNLFLNHSIGPSGSQWVYVPIPPLSQGLGYPHVLIYYNLRPFVPRISRNLFIIGRELPEPNKFYSIRCSGSRCESVPPDPLSWITEGHEKP